MQSGRLSRFIRWGASITCLLLWSASPARAGGIAVDLRAQINADPTNTWPRRVIVQLTPGISINPVTLASTYGGRLIRSLVRLNGSVMSIPQSLLTQLAADPAVQWISPDRPVARQSDYDVQSVGADAAWSTCSRQGGGVRVAVLDTGVRSDTAEWSAGGVSRIVAWQDLVNGQAAPYDDNGHGTHVAGIILGAGSESAGEITGTAPRAGLVALKVLAQDGSGLSSTVMTGIDWCIANKDLYNIRVLNLSLGQKPVESSTTDPLCAAVRRAADAGIVVVCSAGNKGKNSTGATVWGGIGCPGIEPAAITVGAVNTLDSVRITDDTICTYSSRGPTYLDHWAKPDVVAPGNHIVSVRAPGGWLDSRHPENQVDWDTGTPATVDYYQLSGTSMATPQVAGIAAMILEQNPLLDPNTVKGILMFTARRLPLGLTPGLDVLTQGAGEVNALGAVEMAGMLNGAQAVGTYWQTAAFSGQSTLVGAAFSWYAGVLWGDSVLSGSDLFGYRQQAWSRLIHWGDSTSWIYAVASTDNGVAADAPGWSAQAAWDDPGIWGDQLTWGGDDEATLRGDFINPPIGAN